MNNSLEITKDTQWEWGVELTPKTPAWVDPFELEPQINGRSVEWVSDIRKAPGGEKWSFLDCKYKGSNLLVRVLAAAGDRFTLYVERGPLEGMRPKLNGGIHLDVSGRTEAKLTKHVIKFNLPVEIYFPNLRNPLLAAKECPLVQSPKDLPVKLVEVKERQKALNHSYFIGLGSFKNEKIRLWVEHSFSVIGFNFEYESYIDPVHPTFNAELFAIEDHSVLDCSCSRKGKIESLIEIDAAKFNLPKTGWIFVWGPNNSQFGLPELGISLDPYLPDSR